MNLGFAKLMYLQNLFGIFKPDGLVEIMEFVKCVESCYGFEETVEKLKNESERKGWKVVNVIDLRKSLGKDVVILEICKSEFAKKVLDDERNYWISAMMPCRLSVCKQSEGVFVYGVNMDAFAQMIGGELGNLLSDVAKEEEEIVSVVQIT